MSWCANSAVLERGGLSGRPEASRQGNRRSGSRSWLGRAYGRAEERWVRVGWWRVLVAGGFAWVSPVIPSGASGRPLRRRRLSFRAEPASAARSRMDVIPSGARNRDPPGRGAGRSFGKIAIPRLRRCAPPLGMTSPAVSRPPFGPRRSRPAPLGISRPSAFAAVSEPYRGDPVLVRVDLIWPSSSCTARSSWTSWPV
jgi:hypothetical protein